MIGHTSFWQERLGRQDMDLGKAVVLRISIKLRVQKICLSLEAYKRMYPMLIWVSGMPKHLRLVQRLSLHIV